MVKKSSQFLRSYALEILAGFFVGGFLLSILGPKIVLADVTTASQTPDAALIAMAVAALQNSAKPFGDLPQADSASPRHVMRVEVSAYTSRPEETDSTPFTTASGTHVHDGTLATNILKFGTKVRIPALYGDKIFTVEDRMNIRYQNHADIWVDDITDARKIGRRSVIMEVF